MSESLLDKIVVATVGPLIAAVIGTLIIGLFVARITRRAQDRRERYELRRELISEMTEAASALLYVTAHYRMTKRGELGPEVQLPEAAIVLHEQYRRTRTAGSVLEARLQAYFGSDLPRRHWHAAIDLLTMRYFHTVGQMTEDRRVANAGESHSGLTAEQLKEQVLVTSAYNDRMRDATQAVLTEPLSRIGPKA